jgi:prepilin-type N-terminal cleavage/methylation domain-containing protein
MKPFDRSQAGFTLAEMLVAITVLGLLSGAIAAVMVAQLRSASSQQGMATVQSDVNLAMTIIRWDLAQAGLGRPSYVDTVIQSTAPVGLGDNIRVVGTTTASTQADRWSVVLPGGGTLLGANEVMARRWTGAEAERNFRVGDSVLAISSLKQMLGKTKITNIIIDSSAGHENEMILRFSNNIGMLPGSVLFSIGTQGGQAGLGEVANYTYNPATRTLLRNGLPLLENVEQFQVRYFMDQNNDRILDSTSEFQDVFFTTVDPARWNFTPFLIGVTLVTSTPFQESRVVDNRATVDIWDSSYPLNPMMQRRYRNIHTMLVRPRNVGG